MLRALTLACCLVVALAALAQGPPTKPPTDPMRETGKLYTMVGTADVVAVGTVTEVVLPPEPEGTPNVDASFAGPGGMKRVEIAPAKVTFTVDKSLKGGAVAGTKVTVNVPVYPRYEATPEGERAFAGYNLTLAPKDQRVFVLSEGTDGFRAGMGGNDILPIADQSKVEAAIEAIPVTITIKAAPSAYGFGAPNSVKVTVKNTAATPVTITNLNLIGELYAKKLGGTLGFSAVPGPKGEPSTLPTYAKPLVINAGETKDISGYVSASAPPAWALFDAECHLLTPARVRATVSCSITAGAAPATTIRFNVSTAAGMAYVGHPMPK
jgi:hypothetical protein